MKLNEDIKLSKKTVYPLLSILAEKFVGQLANYSFSAAKEKKKKTIGIDEIREFISSCSDKKQRQICLYQSGVRFG